VSSIIHSLLCRSAHPPTWVAFLWFLAGFGSIRSVLIVPMVSVATRAGRGWESGVRSGRR
jgi:hypothetical protein